MITTPLDILTENLAQQLLPGCHYQFAADDEQNKAADKVAPATDPDQAIFFVDATIPVKYSVARNGKLDITYTVTVLLLKTSKPTDPSPLRWPRVVQMIEAGARLLQTLKAHPQVQTVQQIGADVLYNKFDRNADGMGLTYEIVPADTYDYC